MDPSSSTDRPPGGDWRGEGRCPGSCPRGAGGSCSRGLLQPRAAETRASHLGRKHSCFSSCRGVYFVGDLHKLRAVEWQTGRGSPLAPVVLSPRRARAVERAVLVQGHCQWLWGCPLSLPSACLGSGGTSWLWSSAGYSVCPLRAGWPTVGSLGFEGGQSGPLACSGLVASGLSRRSCCGGCGGRGPGWERSR